MNVVNHHKGRRMEGDNCCDNSNNYNNICNYNRYCCYGELLAQLQNKLESIAFGITYN